MTKVADLYSAYRFFKFFSDMDAVDVGVVFCDTSLLPARIFGWLHGIYSSHLVYHSDNVCEWAPYFPSHLARQLNYDQLHVGSPYRALEQNDYLINGIKAWRHFILSSAGVTFRMPTRNPLLLTTLAFY